MPNLGTGGKGGDAYINPSTGQKILGGGGGGGGFGRGGDGNGYNSQRAEPEYGAGGGGGAGGIDVLAIDRLGQDGGQGLIQLYYHS